MSLVQLARVCGPYLWGLLADRCRQRVLIVRLSGAAALVAFSAFFFISRFSGVMLAMAVFSVFWAASLPLVEALTFDHLRDNPGRYSRIRLWGSIGFIIIVQGCGALLDRLPMVAVLWVGGASLAAMVVCSLRLPEAAPHAPATAGAALGEVLRQPRVRALLAASFAMAAAHGTFNIFLLDFSGRSRLQQSARRRAVFARRAGRDCGVLLHVARAAPLFAARHLARLFCRRRGAFRAGRLGRRQPDVDGRDAVDARTDLRRFSLGGDFRGQSLVLRGDARSRGQALYSSLSFGAGGLLGGLISGWAWDHLGGGLTFALSSLYALVGLLLVAIWIGDVGETGASCVRE